MLPFGWSGSRTVVRGGEIRGKELFWGRGKRKPDVLSVCHNLADNAMDVSQSIQEYSRTIDK
jgi:hypothetical protein